MKSVEDNLVLCPWNMVQGGLGIGLPHIHSHSTGTFPLTFRKAPIVGIQTLLLPALSNVLYGGGLKVTYQGQVFMPFGGRLLIYPYVGYHSFPLSLQSSLNRTFQDMPGLIAGDSQNIRGPLDVTFLKQIQGQPLKQQGKLGSVFGPRHLNLQNPMLENNLLAEFEREDKSKTGNCPNVSKPVPQHDRKGPTHYYIQGHGQRTPSLCLIQMSTRCPRTSKSTRLTIHGSSSPSKYR